MIDPANALFEDARGMHLLVALSGGADSVALLVMLHECAPDVRLTCAHVEHGIRGRESLDDAAFCENLCRKMNVPLHIVSVDVPAESARTGEGLETAARRLRHEALERIRVSVNADRIALAHHLNDQAETVLMHLLRGSGVKGACGMPRDDGRLYRPLLGFSKSELEAFLDARGLKWRTDSTNLVSDTPRNALRLNAIPALEESYPNAQRALARFAECAQVENRFLEREVDRFLSARLQRGAYGIRMMQPEAADEAILRRAIDRVCPVSIDNAALVAIAQMANQSRARRDLSGEWFAERTPNAIYFLPKRVSLPVPVNLSLNGATAFLPLGEMDARSAPAKPIADRFRQVLCMDALEGAVIRTRRDGDRIRPLGCGEKSFSDFLIDKKIDRPLRDFLPVIARGNRILWAIGCAVSEDVKIIFPCDRAVMLDWKPFYNF